MTATGGKARHASERDGGPRDDDLIDLLQAITRHLVGATAAAWARVRPPGKLTLPGYRLLVLLTNKPHTPGDLARELHVTPAAVTQLLQGLQEQALVQVGADPLDGRRRIVRATAAAARIVRAMNEERERTLAPVLARLSPGQRKVARDVLGSLIRAFEEPR